jgi:pectate lyase
MYRFRFFFSAVGILLMYSSCAQQKKTVHNMPETESIAFPGAEGYGKYATGGRGGTVHIVTNLSDKGTGSFREAAEKKEKRIIVFAISGTIHLETPLTIRGDVTIAGQTAPGDGICIADHPVGLGGNNIIIRYLRFRLGDRYQNKGMVPGSGHDDALGGNRRNHIIIDHCSLSWSTDECFSVYGGDSTTLQWNIISEPLNYSYHFEEGDKDFERHGFGGIWGGMHLSAHHNLFAHCNNRTPRFNGTRLGATKEFADFRNNVIYNWGGNNIYGGEDGHYNIVNNYYKYGPSTAKAVRFRIVNPSKNNELPFGKWHVHGNHAEGAGDVSRNNWLGIDMGNGGTEEDKKNTIVDQPFPAVPINMETALQAFESVLQYAGASFKRDTLDARIVNDVKNRTGNLIDVQGGYAHGTPYEQTRNAWPSLKTTPAAADTDHDGMPDAWEKAKGLNPNDATDATKNNLHTIYTNIEVYIVSITERRN